jgi:hypothetical protein
MAADRHDADAWWGDEMVRRSRQIAGGEVQTLSLEEVRALVAQRRRSDGRTP